MSYNPVPIARSIELVTDMCSEVLVSNIAGFQIEPLLLQEIGLLGLIDLLEGQQQEVLGVNSLRYNAVNTISNRELRAHMDGGWAGIAMHLSTEGHGRVILAHPRSSSEEFAEEFNRAQYDIFDKRPKGLWHVIEGVVHPGTVTFFSQGGFAGLSRTVHQFKTLPDCRTRKARRIAIHPGRFNSASADVREWAERALELVVTSDQETAGVGR
jgi:hypothetical protein